MNLNFTDTAKERILQFLEAQKAQGVSALRLAGPRAEQKLWLDKDEDRQESEREFDAGEIEVFAAPVSADQYEGATVGCVQALMLSCLACVHPSRSCRD